MISPQHLGCRVFKERHRLSYAYVAGAMYKGIASKELVICMGRAGLLGYLGTGGMRLEEIERNIQAIQGALCQGESYGMNLLASPFKPEVEVKTVDLFLKYGVRRVEAAAFAQVTSALVRYRVSGLVRDAEGRVQVVNRVLAKLSRPEVAEQFLMPPPSAMVARLLAAGEITREEADLAASIPMADDLCVEADSGGHTDRGVALVLLPTIVRMRDEAMVRCGYPAKICVGAAGGIGTPEAVAAVLLLGADFVLTGSINQCTVEAGASDAVKEMLQTAQAQDTDIVPAGDMFEMGAKVQVFKKGLLFPARAKKLYELYQQYDGLEQIDAATRQQLEQRVFKRSFEAIYEETKAYYMKTMPEVIAQAERHPRKKMALIFRWYFVHTSRLALKGEAGAAVDYQIHCGPSLGAFNQWVKGTPLEDWRQRHPDGIAKRLMEGAAAVLNDRFAQWQTKVN